MAVSFQSDILPLFTDDDVNHVSEMGVDLNQYSYMSDPANANNVYNMVSTGQMPIDENGKPVPWSSDKVSLFKSWMEDGYQP